MSYWAQVNASLNISGSELTEALKLINDFIGGMKVYVLQTEHSDTIINALSLKDGVNHHGLMEFDNETRLPTGSEGSLHYVLTPYCTGFPLAHLAIWGALRSFEDLQPILDFFKDFVNHCNKNDIEVAGIYSVYGGRTPELAGVYEIIEDENSNIVHEKLKQD